MTLNDILKITRQKRRFLDLSQRDLAKKIGVTSFSISKWEKRVKKVNASNLINMINALNLEIKIIDKDKE